MGKYLIGKGQRQDAVQEGGHLLRRIWFSVVEASLFPVHPPTICERQHLSNLIPAVHDSLQLLTLGCRHTDCSAAVRGLQSMIPYGDFHTHMHLGHRVLCQALASCKLTTPTNI